MADSDLDPQAFLKTVRDLSEKRQREDNERYEKLEADIVNDRNARLARRMERERSLSPEKSVTYSPRSPRSPHGHVSPTCSSSPSTPNHATMTYEKDDFRGRAMSPLSPRNASPTPDRSLSPIKPSSPSAAMPSRANTMSWQRRPNSVMRSRPLSVVAAENSAARSPLSGNPPASPKFQVNTDSLRDPEGSGVSLGVPGPRQSPGPGRSSPVYRRNVDDELDADEGHQSPLAAQNWSPTRKLPSPASEGHSHVRGQSLSSLLNSTFAKDVATAASAAVTGTPKSPDRELPQSLARTASLYGRTASGRPISPTKGMGGFVQSAMLKRSDSVNKRWSVQSGSTLTRENSIASIRSHTVTPTTLDSPSMPKLDEHRPLGSTRPGSFAAPEIDSLRDTQTHRSLHSRAKSVATLREPSIASTEVQGTFSPPLSPSKRWSPQKSSWLESALSRPESPITAASPVVQPSWMAEINKWKLQRNGADPAPPAARNVPGSTRSTPAHTPKPPSPIVTSRPSTPLSSILQNSPKPAPAAESDSARTSLSNGLGLVGHSPVVASEVISGTVQDKSSAADRAALSRSPTRTSDTSPARFTASGLSGRHLSGASPNGKVADGGHKEEPEFRSALGSLRRTQTKNYVAPDVLRDNILRGKAGLAVTGGPQKSVRRDVLKESLLKKREEMATKSADSPPVQHGMTSVASGVATPEALVKRRQLGRGPVEATSSKTVQARRDITPEALALLKSMKNKSARQVLADKSDNIPDGSGATWPTQKAGDATSDSADAGMTARPISTVPSDRVTDRANPALEALLSRGAKAGWPVDSKKETYSISASDPDLRVPGDVDGDGRQLVHVTKTRAKGPKRRKPKSDREGEEENRPVSV